MVATAGPWVPYMETLVWVFTRWSVNSWLGRLGEHGLLPEAGGETAVGLGAGIKAGLGKVAWGGGVAPAPGVAVLCAVHQQLSISSSFWGPGAGTMPVPLVVGMRPPTQSNTGQAPCKGQCGACQPCFPSSLATQGLWRTLPA